MCKCFAELKKAIFYGTLEGNIVQKKVYIDFLTGKIYDNIKIVLLNKKVNVFGKEINKYKEIIVDKEEIEKFKIGDYYFAE